MNLRVTLTVLTTMCVIPMSYHAHIIHTSPKTYTINNGTQFPHKLISLLKSKSDVQVVLPSKLYLRKQPGLILVATEHVTKHGYQITLNWQQKGSHTYLGAAYYAGTITAFEGVPSNNTFTKSYKTKRLITLKKGTTITEYFTNKYVMDGAWAVWNKNNWKFFASGAPDQSTPYDLTTIGLARNLSHQIMVIGLPIQSVKSGFIVDNIYPDHNEIDVSWTYNGKVWYAINGYDQNLGDVLREARSVIR